MDKDIFGPPKGYKEVGGDEDIFAPPPQSKSAPKEQEEESPRTLGDRVRSNPMILSPWGPAILASELANEQIEKAAYNAGGAVTDLTGSPAAGYVANVATQAVPTFLAGSAAQRIGGPLMQSAGRNMMQRAVKPTLADQESGDAKRAIDTMLKRGVDPTEAGVQELSKAASKRGQEVEKALESSNAVLERDRVAAGVDRISARLREQVAGDADVALSEGVKQQFLRKDLTGMGMDIYSQNEIPVQLAQRLKSGTYEALGKKAYGELKGPEIEAQKALAHNLKEGISQTVPGVAKPLAEQADLLNAISVMQRRAMMGNNRDLAGITTLSENPLAWAAGMADRSTVAKSLLARGLYSGSDFIPNLLAQILAARYMAGTGVADSPVLDLTGMGALYEPPQRGAPKGRLGGGSR